MEVPEKKFFRMAPGQEVRLRGACIFKCTGCVKDAAGKVVEIHGTWDASVSTNAPLFPRREYRKAGLQGCST